MRVSELSWFSNLDYISTAYQTTKSILNSTVFKRLLHNLHTALARTAAICYSQWIFCWEKLPAILFVYPSRQLHFMALWPRCITCICSAESYEQTKKNTSANGTRLFIHFTVPTDIEQHQQNKHCNNFILTYLNCAGIRQCARSVPVHIRHSDRQNRLNKREHICAAHSL